MWAIDLNLLVCEPYLDIGLINGLWFILIVKLGVRFRFLVLLRNVKSLISVIVLKQFQICQWEVGFWVMKGMFTLVLNPILEKTWLLITYVIWEHCIYIPGINKMVIAIPETKANLTCIYKRHKATPICNGKLKQSSNRSGSKTITKDQVTNKLRV